MHSDTDITGGWSLPARRFRHEEPSFMLVYWRLVGSHFYGLLNGAAWAIVAFVAGTILGRALDVPELANAMATMVGVPAYVYSKVRYVQRRMKR